MKFNTNFIVSFMLARRVVNPYNIIIYKENNINKDYEISSFNTRVFS